MSESGKYATIPRIWDIKESNVTLLEGRPLGEGMYSQVFCGVWLGCVPVAVKIAKFGGGYQQKVA